MAWRVSGVQPQEAHDPEETGAWASLVGQTSAVHRIAAHCIARKKSVHVEEVLSVAEVLSGGVDEWPSDAVAVGERRNGGQGSDEAVDLLVAETDVLVDLLAGLDQRRVRLRVERAQRCHRRDDHAHRVRVVAERRHQLGRWRWRQSRSSGVRVE